MNEENEIIYVPEKKSFKIKKVKEMSKSIFFILTRFLLQFDCEGKKWQENIFCIIHAILLFSAVFTDIIAGTVILTCVAVYMLLKLIFAVLTQILKTVVENFLGTAIKITVIILVILIVLLKWQNVKEIIINLF